MALAGDIPPTNCKKRYTFMLYLETRPDDALEIKRGGPVGTGEFVCKDAPWKSGQVIHPDLNMPVIDLTVEVEKQLDEVDNPDEGIKLTCNEKNCRFNIKGKERW